MTSSRNDSLIDTAKHAQLGNYRPAPIVLTEGKGVRVRDADGREYLDFAGGLAVTSVGHAHPKLQRAIAEQAGKLLHVSNLFYNDKQIAFADALTKRTGFARAFFCNSGTEANEAMLKLARRHQFASGKPERTGFVATIHSFHGRTYGALSVTGQPKYHEGMAPMLPGVTFVPYDDLPAMAAAINETTAAVIVEPIQAEGGLFVPSAGYLRALRELCDQRGALLCFDEVQTGYGRTGKFMGAEHDGVRPDACSLAKGIAGGFPLGAMLASEKVAGALVPGTHASTFGGNPLACAAALCVLEIFDEEKLVENAAARGQELATGLDALVKEHRGVIERRGRGLLQGVLLAEGVDPARALEQCRERGLLATIAGGRVIRVCPALTVSADEVREGLSLLSGVLAALSKELLS